MRTSTKSLAAAVAVATSLTFATPAQAEPAAPAPAPAPVAISPAPGTSFVFGSSAGSFVPSIIGSIIATVALTLLLNSGVLASASGKEKTKDEDGGLSSGGSSKKAFGSTIGKGDDSGSVKINFTTKDQVKGGGQAKVTVDTTGTQHR